MQFRTRQMLTIATIAVGFVVTLAGLAQAQGNDSSLGTWKLNVAKSTYEPGPAPKSETRVYEIWEKDGVKATMTTVGADGKTVIRGYAAHYDGKTYPYTGTPEYDAIVLKRIDARTTEGSNRKGGKEVQTTRTVISADGKTRTLTANGTNLKGQKVHNVLVFDKQ